MRDRIASIELFLVPPRWVFLKMATEQGLVGWGEPVLEGKAETVVAAVHEMRDHLMGQDPDRIEDTYQLLYRGGFYRGGPILMSAISGIEQALWDIKGKRLGVPVYELLGGACRDRVLAYCWIGGDRANEAVDTATIKVNQGWRALKMNVAPQLGWIETPQRIEEIVTQVSDVRDAIGWDIDLALDFHGRVRRSVVKRLINELEPLKPMFIEEPVLPDQLDVYEQLYCHTSIPIATGERLFGRHEFADLLQRGCVDFIQPDLSHAGGIWEVRKIAALAEVSDVAVAPHCPLGPIALAASLQLDYCTPNAVIQETSLGIHYNLPAEVELTDYVIDSEPFRIEEGHFLRHDRPGLGIEVNEEVVREAAREPHRWRNPLWRHRDGSVAEW